MNTCSNLLILKCIRPKYFASCKCIRCTLWRCATRVVWSSDVRSLKIDNLAKRVKSKVSILSRSCCTLAHWFYFALSVALKLLAKYFFLQRLEFDNLAKKVKGKVSILSRSCCTLAQYFHFALSVAQKLLAKYIFFRKAWNLTTWQRELKVKLVF